MTVSSSCAGRIALVAILAAASPMSALTQRDATAVQRPGTATVSGVVTTTDATPQPIRRAIVSLYNVYNDAQPLGRHTVTDDEGRFMFASLVEGRYEIYAARQSFVTIAYGATRPGRAGARLEVRTGEQLQDVRVLLARGAVITGTVRDADGQPIRNIDVRVEARGPSPSASLPVVVGAPATTVRTDDRGEYRFFALAQGTYVVSARPLMSGTSDLSIPSDNEVDAALRELQQRRAAPPRPAGAPTIANVPSRPRGADFVPVFHPTAFSLEDAADVVVQPGEEKTGIDITLRMMSAAAVSGQIVDMGGRAPVNIEIGLTKTLTPSPVAELRTIPRADGTFRLSSVTPGRYLLTARATAPDAMPQSLGIPDRSGKAAAQAAPCAFAAEEVRVAGDDLSGLSLTLRPCLAIAGRIELAPGATSSAPLPFGSVRISLQPDATAGIPMFAPLRAPAAVGRDGRFVLGEFGDVLPGIYHLKVEIAGSEAGRGWWLQSATVEGRDVLDTPLRLSTDSPTSTSVVLTLTDSHTSLSGVFDPGPRRSPADYTVIAFTTNREWWRAPYRRIRITRPTTKGEYLLHDLPPGEYYVAALTDLAPDDVRDAAFLGQIVGAAIRVTIAPGEQKVLRMASK